MASMKPSTSIVNFIVRELGLRPWGGGNIMNMNKSQNLFSLATVAEDKLNASV